MSRVPAIIGCIGLAAFGCLSLVRAQAPPPGSTDRARIEAGRGLFADTCANEHCHGGSAPDVRDFPRRTPEEVRRIIAEGIPTKGMPPFKDVFSPEQLEQVIAYVLSQTGESAATVQAAPSTPPPGAAAAPLEAGSSDQQVTGAYEVVKDWPKPMSSWPGHQGWTWGATQGIFAESPDRIFIVQRGELKELKQPIKPTVIDVEGAVGPVRLSAPVRGVPPRNASVDPLGSPGEPNVAFQGIEGKDYRWEHLILVVDREGNLVESWTQWDKLIKRPHRILISPYDPEKRVWVVDDGNHAIYVFSNDGKKLLQTIGTRGETGEDGAHFGRQTDIAWLPDGTFFVSDGYENTRVVKFDKNGKFLKAWGQRGEAGKETRPGYFNTVHGIAVDDKRRVYVVDRANRRIQIFDEEGNFLRQWYLGDISATYHLFMTADRHLWMADGHSTWKILKYDLNGNMLYSWGTWGALPGQLWGVHQVSVDREGNLYTAEVFNGRAQKFRPKKGADPAKLVGQPVRAAWN